MLFATVLFSSSFSVILVNSYQHQAMAQSQKSPVNNIHVYSIASHNQASSSIATNVRNGSNTSISKTQTVPSNGHEFTVSNLTLPLNLTKPIKFELKARDPDKNDTLAFYIVRFPAHGILSGISGHNVTRQQVFNITYTPRSTSFSDNFTYKARDPTDRLNSLDNATVVLDHPPTVSDLKITSNGTKPYKVILAGSDPDKGDKLTFSIVQRPLNGLLTDPSGNSSMFSPNPGFIGHDKFTYRAKDSSGLSSNNGTVSVNVVKPPSFNVTGPTAPISTASTLPLTTTVLIYAGVVAGFMLLPLVYDMKKTYKQRGRPGPETSGFPDLARSLMAFGIIIILAILAFHVLVTITYTALPTTTNTALVDIIKNLSTILGGAVSAIIGFYFGQRTLERRDTSGGARAAVGSGPSIIDTVPSDGSHPVPVDTPITATFSEPVTVEPSSLTLKDANNNSIEGGNVLYQDGKTLKFENKLNLSPSTTYIATITGVKNLAGNSMSSPKTWKFTTAPTKDTTNPTKGTTG